MVLTLCLCLRQKAQQKLKLPVAPSLLRMQMYRWACQALTTSPDHPLLPLVWQKFLQLYLRQPGPEYGYAYLLLLTGATVMVKKNYFMSPRVHRCVLPIRLAAGGCIGRRFFQSSSQAALLRELRQKIQEVSNFHHAASQALRVPPPHTPSSDSQGSPDNPLQPYLTSPQLHTELVRYL